MLVRLLPLVCLAVVCALPSAAWAKAYLPPKGKVWHGVTAGRDLADFRERTGKAPSVWQHFITWGQSYRYTLERSEQAGARLMLHLSTADGQGRPGRITPGRIARGDGDGFLLGLNSVLADHGRPVYLRPMGEMNNCHNAYAPVSCDGRARGAEHSARRFRQAWKRIRLIVRGGDVAGIDARLRRLGLPALRTAADRLPRARVAFVWAPMTAGSPMIAALDPRRFWPGRGHVDWVGTSFYSRFPNFHLLEPFYRRYAVGARKPFALAEWAMWGRDDPRFARRLFGWVARHPRVRMLQYNQGQLTSGPFRLKRFPRAARVIRRALASERFQQGGRVGLSD